MNINNLDVSVLKPDDIVICRFPTDREGYPIYNMVETSRYFECIYKLLHKNVNMVLLPDKWGLETMSKYNARKYISSLVKALDGEITWR